MLESQIGQMNIRVDPILPACIKYQDSGTRNLDGANEYSVDPNLPAYIMYQDSGTLTLIWDDIFFYKTNQMKIYQDIVW